MLAGGDSGPAVAPGKPEESPLLDALKYDGVEMPPKGKLPDPVLADLAAWVKMGAPWPNDGGDGGPAKTAGFDLARRKREHWCWQPVRPQAPPAVRDAAWPRGPVDRFVLAKLEEKSLHPAPAADRRTLLRRVTFDLTGLPPAPEEIDAFLADTSPDAYEKVVDRLLESPQFGERWARHWLDLVRYGETRGHEFDPNIPDAYQYRDYVVRALNADVPYDQFVREHVAGDLLPNPRRNPPTPTPLPRGERGRGEGEGFNESIIGSGFWFLGEEVHSPVDVRQDQADRFDNRIDVFGKTFLGLTVACARCHDHKFDAISSKDYYALYGFLSSGSYRLARFDSIDQDRAAAAELAKVRGRGRAEIGKALAAAARPAAEYLLAAREALLAEGEPDCDRTAAARRLDAALLRGWVNATLNAARDRDDPLHAWAVVATDPAAKDARRVGELLRPVADEMRRRDAAADAVLKGAQVVIDYAHCASADWMPDDAAFGPGPVRPGDVRLTADGPRVVERGAAEYDRDFDGLRLAPGAETDPGALGRVTVRSGRTLCTPTFRLTTGRVFYLVRGAGAAYASVGSHVEIDGPLHAQLVTSLPAGKDFHWAGQDLTRYRGLDAHLEFTAAPGSDFAVALVVQAEQAPGPIGRPSHVLLALADESKSVEALAAGYGRLFAGLAKRLAADDLAGSPDDARLAGWLLRHRELVGETKALDEKVEALRAAEKKAATAIRADSRLCLAMLDGSGVDEHVFVRGSPKAAGEPAPRRFLEALAGPEPLAPAHGSGRLELARQMTDPSVNPLIARVMVNRVWHHVFGRGIVASVDNFGVLGEAPTHPELLDFLADRFVKDGWSVKRLIRSLVLTHAYQMSSNPDARARQLDPQDLLLYSMRVRRLEAEAIRDAILAASGRLDRHLYGPSVPIHLTPFLDGRGRPASGPLDGDGRRSLYLAVRRN
ncbi:MAG TPA: PSD1 and planctomycete cytochrome C domain-containing protein, partial [Gemmataceae bacterium]|nr:PSD1 and planctomycete cytochrome C domain-containing protein [Gemmataceae bacterium]